MADINDVTEVEVQDHSDDDQTDTGSETQQESDDDQESGQDNDEVIVSIGDAAPPSEEEKQHEAAPQWVKDLRKESREKDKLIRELKAKQAAPAQQEVVVSAKPSLADCDFDEDEYDKRILAWQDSKRQADEAKSQKEKEQKDAESAWQESLGKYNTAKAQLKVPDFAEAEEVVLSILSTAQSSIIVDGAARPDLIIYALGKSPEKAKELSSIKNPVKFAFAVANLEKELKVTQKKAPPPPEKTVRGNAAVAPSDARLEALEAEAEKTGNRNKIIAYKKQLAAK